MNGNIENNYSIKQYYKISTPISHRVDVDSVKVEMVLRCRK